VDFPVPGVPVITMTGPLVIVEDCSRKRKRAYVIIVVFLSVALILMDVENDEIVSVLPIHYSDVLSPNIHIHQFPLLNRPLQVPPTAAASGKFIKARLKPNSRRLEIHVPVDTRPEVRNLERSKQLGAARLEDDRDKETR
jgi:hypothetical protein